MEKMHLNILNKWLYFNGWGKVQSNHRATSLAPLSQAKALTHPTLTDGDEEKMGWLVISHSERAFINQSWPHGPRSSKIKSHHFIRPSLNNLPNKWLAEGNIKKKTLFQTLLLWHESFHSKAQYDAWRGQPTCTSSHETTTAKAS